MKNTTKDVSGSMDPQITGELGGVGPLKNTRWQSRRNNRQSGRQALGPGWSSTADFTLSSIQCGGRDKTGSRKDGCVSLSSLLPLLKLARQGVRFDVVGPRLLGESWTGWRRGTTWLEFSVLAVWRHSKFLWSVHTWNRSLVPSSQWLHSSMAIFTTSSSRLLMSEFLSGDAIMIRIWNWTVSWWVKGSPVPPQPLVSPFFYWTAGDKMAGASDHNTGRD